MSEYTPTTDEVEDYYAHGQFADPAMSEHDHAKAFRRWLAEVERAAAARALEEAAEEIFVRPPHIVDDDELESFNAGADAVYDALHARAAEYRKAVQ